MTYQIFANPCVCSYARAGDVCLNAHTLAFGRFVCGLARICKHWVHNWRSLAKAQLWSKVRATWLSFRLDPVPISISSCVDVHSPLPQPHPEFPKLCRPFKQGKREDTIVITVAKTLSYDWLLYIHMRISERLDYNIGIGIITFLLLQLSYLLSLLLFYNYSHNLMQSFFFIHIVTNISVENEMTALLSYLYLDHFIKCIFTVSLSTCALLFLPWVTYE